MDVIEGWRTASMVTACLAVGACVSPPDPRCSFVDEATFEPEPLGTPPEWWGTPPLGDGFGSVLLPRDYARAAVYPLALGDPAYARLSFGVGTADVTVAVTVFVLVEGRAVEVLADGVPIRRIDLGLGGGSAEVEITIPPSALSPGLNQVDLLYFAHRSGNWRLYPGMPFTVANGSLAPQVYEDTPDLELAPYAPYEPTVAYREVPAGPIEEARFGAWTPAAGSLPDPTLVTLRVQAGSLWAMCTRSEGEGARLDRVMLVAFRDLEPEPLGEIDRLVATLPMGEQRVYQYEFPLFPAGEQHNYTVAALSGFGRPARMANGTEAPWAGAVPVIQVWWGWSP